MPRARNIKPSFFTNEDLVELPIADRLLFIGLWTMADRRGRMEDRPKRIKITLFPADNIDVDKSLNRLQDAGFIQRYQADGGRFIQIWKFERHQNPHKNECDSSIPAPDGHGASTVQAPESHGAAHADSPSLIPESSKYVGKTVERFVPPTDANAMRAQCERNAGAPKNDAPTQTRSKRFIPPTVDQVREYCKERKNQVDAQRFVDFYEAKGWMVGKNKMKSWQAAVRTWEAKDQESQPVRRRKML